MNTLYEVMSLLVIDAVELMKVLHERVEVLELVCCHFYFFKHIQVLMRVNVQHSLFIKQEHVC